MTTDRDHPKDCGCAVCTRRRERLEAEPRERELAASEGDPEFEHSPGDQSEPAHESTVQEHHHHEHVERERTVEHHHHDRGKAGKDGKDGSDGKRGDGSSHGHRFARKNHHHPRRGLLRTLVVGFLLLFVLHSFYPNLNIPLVPGIACAPGPITQTTPSGATPVSAAGVEPVGLGSDLGGLAQDTIGAVLKSIAVAAAEKVLHEVGDTVKAMLSHAPSPADIRTGLANDFELAGKAVGFVIAGLQGKPLGGGTNVSTTAAGGGCGACPGTAVPANGPALPGLTGEQSRNAYTIIRTGQSMRVPQRGWVVALAAASQESGLRNVHYGMDDSQGLFQMRPSMGWGTVAQVTDPVYASRKFYTTLNRVRGWSLMSVSQAAQAVERSGFPDAYAKWEDRAWAVVRAATAKAQVRSVAYTVPRAAVSGLQPVAVQAENYVRRAFGFTGTIGGFARSGHISNSKHYQGLAIDVMVPLGAQADRITNYFAGPGYARWHVDNVIHNHRIFNAGQGWHAYPERGNPTLNHEDHVHIDFVSGAPVSAAVAGAAPAASCGGLGVVTAAETQAVR